MNMSLEQMSACRAAFERDAMKDGERAVLDSDTKYTNVLHRVQWRKWVSAWESCLDSGSHTMAPESLSHLRNETTNVRDVSAFLENCRISGVFFDGNDAVGNKGVYFVSQKTLDELTPLHHDVQS